MKKSIFQVLKVVVIDVVITLLSVLLLSILLYKFRFGDKAVRIGIVSVYVISNFIGGYIIGKIKENRKFIWGAITGLMYFLVLTIVSVMITGVLYGNGGMALAAFLSSMIAGIVGGMVS